MHYSTIVQFTLSTNNALEHIVSLLYQLTMHYSILSLCEVDKMVPELLWEAFAVLRRHVLGQWVSVLSILPPVEKKSWRWGQ